MATKRVATTSNGKNVEITNYGAYDLSKLSKEQIVTGLTTTRNFANIVKPVTGEVKRSDLICKIGGVDHLVTIFLGIKTMKDGEEASGSAFLSKTAAANFLNTLDTSSMEKFKDSYVKNFMPFISKHYAKLDQGLLCKISAEEVQVEGQDVVQRLRAVANESFKFEKWMEKYNITESDIDLLDPNVVTLDGMDEFNALLQSETGVSEEFINCFESACLTRSEVDAIKASAGVQVA